MFVLLDLCRTEVSARAASQDRQAALVPSWQRRPDKKDGASMRVRAKKLPQWGLGQRWQEISLGFKKRPQYAGPSVTTSFRADYPNGLRVRSIFPRRRVPRIAAIVSASRIASSRSIVETQPIGSPRVAAARTLEPRMAPRLYSSTCPGIGGLRGAKGAKAASISLRIKISSPAELNVFADGNNPPIARPRVAQSLHLDQALSVEGVNVSVRPLSPIRSSRTGRFARRPHSSVAVVAGRSSAPAARRTAAWRAQCPATGRGCRGWASARAAHTPATLGAHRVAGNSSARVPVPRRKAPLLRPQRE
jgi:hypothetical protein